MKNKSHDRLLTDAIKAAEAYRKEAEFYKGKAKLDEMFADAFAEAANGMINLLEESDKERARLRGFIRGITWGIGIGMLGLIIWSQVW